MLEIQRKQYDEDDMRLAIICETFYMTYTDRLFHNPDFETYDDMIALCEEIKKQYLEDYDSLPQAQQGYIVEYADSYLFDKYIKE